SEHCETIWNSATWLASYSMEITGWIWIELLGLLGIVCHSDGNGGSSGIGCVYDVPAAYQFVPANAGMPPRRYADALGPAWLHSAFGQTIGMRFGLIDLLFASGCIAIGMIVGQLLASGLPSSFRPIAGPVAGVGLYLAFVYPFYRCLKLFPMILPRCPCCANFQHGFHILGGHYPRITFR